MSTVNNGPQIVRSGLILDLDAGYMRSYSPNVVPYPTDLFAWCGAAATNSCTISRDTTMTRQYGSTPMKMTVTGTDPYVDTINSTIWSLAPAVIGQTWTMSVYAKASVSTTGELLIFGADSSGSIVDFDFVTINITNSWTRFSLTYTLVDSACAFIQIRLDGTPTFGSGINIWWDGLQVERASAATNFNPYYIGNTVWKDVSGNNNNGIFGASTAAPTYSNQNRGSLVFDGSNDYISITNNSTLRPASELTIEYIIKGTTPSGWCPIIGYGNGDYTNGNYLCWVETGGALQSLCRINNGGVIEYRQYSGIGISTTTLKCMSFTMKIGDSIKSYYNGVNTNTATNLPAGGSFYYGGTSSPYQIVGLGGAWLNGSILFFRLYNRALTAAEVSQNYEATKTRFGL